MLPLLEKVKSAYLLWFGYYLALPKAHRHSLGQRIDTAFINLIEIIAVATFLPKDEKSGPVRQTIGRADTLKVLLMVLWESKSLDSRKYAALSVRLEEIGRMLGGWSGQLRKQNSPAARPGEK
ncbi:four helix bundle protein [Candidatus Uhrbacteria bacterium]|nr:four helix bundle protein [Candidatus Uhrbacteria bacterium]